MSLVSCARTGSSRRTYLRGICFLVMGSYPTHATPAFAQLLQLGSFWSQRFLRRRHLLHALTLRKLELFPAAAALEAWTAPSAWSSLGDSGSFAGDWGPADSAEVWRWRFAGCEFGDGGSWREVCIASGSGGGGRELGERAVAELPASLGEGTAMNGGTGRHLTLERMEWLFSVGSLEARPSNSGMREA